MGGGVANAADGLISTISGGFFNRAQGYRSAVGGGESKEVRGTNSTVGGGLNNDATGAYAKVPGGRSNAATNYALNGEDDKHIATVDADTVALAAIQGLHQKLEQRLEKKETGIAELKDRLENVGQLLNHELNGRAK